MIYVSIGMLMVLGGFIGLGVAWSLIGLWILFGDFIERWKYPYASTSSGIPEQVEKWLGIPQARLIAPKPSKGSAWTREKL